MKHVKQLFFLFLLMTSLAGPWVLAQDPPAQSPLPRPDQIKPAMPETEPRVGVDINRRVTLTLRDAITMGLENNRDIEVERLNVQINQFDLLAARGAYDPRLTGNLGYERAAIPVASVLAGQNGRLETDGVVGTANLTQRIPWQGGNLQVIFDNERATTTNLFTDLNPAFTTTLSATYTQPLWRNRGIDLQRRQVRIASKRLDISDSQFRQRAIEIISQVQRAYWDLVFARRDQQIKRESVGLAQTQLEHNRRLVDAGALAPADVISARLEVERRTDEAEAAVEAIQRTENELKALISSPNNAEFWGSALVPAEDPQLDPGPALPIDDALRLAFRSRPEMEQFRLRGELNQIDVDYYRNQSRPQIDLFATYGTQGLAGRRRGGINPIFGGNALLYERVNRLSELAGLVPLPVPTPGTVPTFLIGGYGTSLATLFKNDFRTWRVGVSFDIPLRNRTAEGQLGRALTEGRQLDAQRQRIEQTIEVEVRNALQAVETAKRRIAAALKSRDDARLQYESEVRKFDAGQSTNFFVLDRQNALSSAQVRLLRAYTDYTKSVAELQRALSTTLSSQSIEVK